MRKIYATAQKSRTCKKLKNMETKNYNLNFDEKVSVLRWMERHAEADEYGRRSVVERHAYLEETTLGEVASELIEKNGLNEPYAHCPARYDANGCSVFYHPYGDYHCEFVRDFDSEEEAEEYAAAASVIAANYELNESLDYYTEDEVTSKAYIREVADVMDVTAEEAEKDMEDYANACLADAKSVAEAAWHRFTEAKANANGRMTKNLRRAIDHIKHDWSGQPQMELAFRINGLMTSEQMAEVMEAEKCGL